jgi:hypothetical protein
MNPQVHQFFIDSDNMMSFVSVSADISASPHPISEPKINPTFPKWLAKLPVRHADYINNHGLATNVQLEDAGFIAPAPTFPGAGIACESDGNRLYLENGVNIPDNIRLKHLKIFGKTGSGKSGSGILPILLSDIRNGFNCVLTDVKGDLFGPVQYFISKHAPTANLTVVDLTDATTSAAVNLLAGLRTEAELTEVFESYYPAVKLNETAHFRQHSITISTQIGLALIKVKKKDTCFPEIAKIIRGGHRAIYKLGTEAKCQELIHFSQQVGQSNADTTYSDLTLHFSLFLDATLAAIISRNELSFDMFDSDTQQVLYLRFPENLRRLKWLQSALVDRMFAYVTQSAANSENGALKRRLSIVFDEFAVLGRMPSLESSIHTLRSRRVSLVAATQSISQLKRVYGEDADALMAGFNTFMFIPILDYSDAELASRLSGEMVEEIYELSKHKRILSKMPQLRRVLQPLDVTCPSIHPKFGPLTTIISGNLVFQAALPKIFQYEGLTHWDRSMGGEYPDSRVPKRSIPLEEIAEDSEEQESDDWIRPPTGLTIEQIDHQITLMKKELDYDGACLSTKRFWKSLEKLNLDKRPQLWVLLKEIAKRGNTIEQFHWAYVQADSDNWKAVLTYLKYLNLKKAGKQTDAPIQTQSDKEKAEQS